MKSFHPTRTLVQFAFTWKFGQSIKKAELFYFALLLGALSFAQSKSFQISGTILSEENLPLESATVYLENVVDSTLVTYTISDKNGGFVLKGKSGFNSLNLYISYVGYATYEKKIPLDKPIIELNKVYLKPDGYALQAVIVESRAPIVVKKDTLEFNVSSFKTKKDANVEDLLKKLPFVQVSTNGEISVNGKEVNKILVNGKEFFGKDVTAATRNLTKGIIEKVQITDTKTTSEAFREEEGDKTKKTINLTIKEENNKGIFGRVASGGGTDKRYELSGIVNWFNGDRKVNVLANKNNTIPDIRNSHGGNSFNSKSDQGIMVSSNIGANYVDRFANKADLTVNFSRNGSQNENIINIEQENILPNSSYYSTSNSEAFADNRTHLTNANFDIKIDPKLFIHVSPSFTSSNNFSSGIDTSQSFNSLRLLTNESTVSSFSNSSTTGFRTNIDINKGLGKNSFLRFSISQQYDTNQLDSQLESKASIYDYDTVNENRLLLEEINRNQAMYGNGETNTIITNTSYTLPVIPKKSFLTIGYTYNSSHEITKNSTFDFNSTTNGFTDFNLELSTDYESIRTDRTSYVNFGYANKKLSVGFIGQSIFTTLENKDVLRSELDDRRKFETQMLMTDIGYSFSDKLSVQTRYRLNNTIPQLSQLLSFDNITDPLNIVAGNPLLKPTKSHEYSGSFRNFDLTSGLGFFIVGNLNIFENQIVTKTIIDEQSLEKRTTYDNVNGSSTMRVDAAFMKKIKLDSLNTLDVNFRLVNSTTKQINFNNDFKYASKNNSFSPQITLNYNWKNVLEIAPTYRMSFSTITFDITQFEKTEFITHSLGLSTSTFLPKRLEWSNQINFNYNSNVAPGFQKSAWLWNSTFTYSTWKDMGFLSLKIYDLLDQNTNAKRIATENFIQDVQSTVLRQYFMLSFSWKFSSLSTDKV